MAEIVSENKPSIITDINNCVDNLANLDEKIKNEQRKIITGSNHYNKLIAFFTRFEAFLSHRLFKDIPNDFGIYEKIIVPYSKVKTFSLDDILSLFSVININFKNNGKGHFEQKIFNRRF